MADALNRNLSQNQFLQYLFDDYWSAQAPTAHHRHGTAHSDGTGYNELSIVHHQTLLSLVLIDPAWIR